MIVCMPYIQAVFTSRANPTGLRFLSYYLILFPSLDVISAFPLSNHVIVNNLYILITGHDTSKDPIYKFDIFLRILLRVVNALLPIVAAFCVANIIYIIKYAGFVGFLCLAFPVLLQIKSIYVCKKRFSSAVVVDKRESPLLMEKLDAISSEENTEASISERKELLLAEDREEEPVYSEHFYMTPYSTRAISHPVAVLVIGGIGAFVLLLAVLSLILHPRIENCGSLLDLIFVE